MAVPAPSQHTHTNTGVRDAGQRAGTSVREDAWLGGLVGLEELGGPGSWWGLPFPFPFQHSNLEAEFAIAEEKLQLSLALQR